MMRVEGIPQLSNDRVALESFNGLHLPLVAGNRKHQARADWLAIYQHSARPAHPNLAPDVRTREVALVTQIINEQQTGRNFVNRSFAIDFYGNFHLIA
jgi:hypothetical protein